MKFQFFLSCVLLMGGCEAVDLDPSLQPATQPATQPAAAEGIDLGCFSVSLNVKDIVKSREFYEKLGFHVVAGKQSQRWLVLENHGARVGIFQGMFDRNMLDFNPGRDRDAKDVAKFQDVRDIQAELKRRGLTPEPAADESSTGAAFFIVKDPDGNPVLVDQFAGRPGK